MLLIRKIETSSGLFLELKGEKFKCAANQCRNEVEIPCLYLLPVCNIKYEDIKPCFML